MIKLILGTCLVFVLVACGDYTGDSESSYVGDTTNTDNSIRIDNSVDNSFIVKDNNGTITYHSPSNGDEVGIDTDGDGEVDEMVDIADTVSGEYDSTYDATECAQNGYFFCTIEQKCLNQPSTGSSCSK